MEKLPCQNGMTRALSMWKQLYPKPNHLDAMPRHLMHQLLLYVLPNLYSQGIHGYFAANAPSFEVQLLPPVTNSQHLRIPNLAPLLTYKKPLAKQRNILKKRKAPLSIKEVYKGNQT